MSPPMSPGIAAAQHDPDLLVFSHANGFPAPTYRRVLGALGARFDVSHVLRFGHDPHYPVSRGWPGLARQLLDHIETLPTDRRVWLVGHSLGGYLSILAGAQSGERIAGIVLLDSPLIGSVTEHLIKLGRRTGFDQHMMPLRQTLQRRTHWPDVDSVEAHFSVKPGFKRWDPEVLRDYACHATTEESDGRRLLFDREVEHSIYSTLPTGCVRGAADRLRAPVAFIAGMQSREVRQIGLRATRRLVGTRLEWIAGSHLFPMEHPDAAAAGIIAAIDGMRGGMQRTDAAAGGAGSSRSHAA